MSAAGEREPTGMLDVVLRLEGAATLDAEVDGRSLAVAEGAATARLMPGSHHLAFELRGAPGKPWTAVVQVVGTSRPLLALSGRLDPKGFAAGVATFSTAVPADDVHATPDGG